MKAWWQQLNSREQLLMVVMSVLVLIFMIYQFIWQPVNIDIKKTQEKIARQQKLLIWVQENTERYQQAKINSVNKSGSLTSIINRTSKMNNININRMQPQGDDLQVWIEEIPFNQLLSWLAQLASKYELKVKNIDLSKAEQEGVVQVRRLQLGRN